MRKFLQTIVISQEEVDRSKRKKVKKRVLSAQGLELSESSTLQLSNQLTALT